MGAVRRDLAVAAAFLTRLPVPMPADASGTPLAAAARAFPVIGVLVGGIAALALLLGAWLDWHPLLCALVAIGVATLVTGALHEDGLADVADGFAGGRDAAKRLAIMRDSRIGAFGALALVLSVAVRAGALAGMRWPEWAALALVAAHVLSRAVLPAAMVWLPPARADGLGAGAGRPTDEGAVAAAVLGLLLAFLFAGFAAGIVAALAAAAAAVALGLWAKARIGGQTGDVLGAMQQAAEIAALLALASAFA